MATISADLHSPEATLRLTGAWSIENAAELHQAALALLACAKDVWLDWTAAVRIDASILQIILALRQDLAGAGRSFSATPPNAEIVDYLRVAGFSCLLDRDIAP